MKTFFPLMIMSMILLTSCSRLAEKLEVIPDRKSTLEREPFKEFSEDYT
ncbi:MAG: Unknown protein, partial [uncultured Sulfurovum sp.]